MKIHAHTDCSKCSKLTVIIVAIVIIVAAAVLFYLKSANPDIEVDQGEGSIFKSKQISPSDETSIIGPNM